MWTNALSIIHAKMELHASTRVEATGAIAKAALLDRTAIRVSNGNYYSIHIRQVDVFQSLAEIKQTYIS